MYTMQKVTLTVSFLLEWGIWMENTDRSHKFIKTNHIVLLGVENFEHLCHKMLKDHQERCTKVWQ